MTDPQDRKVVLITGGCRGIGKAFATCLAEAGHTVFTTARSSASAQVSIQSKVHNLQLDVTKEADVLSVFASIKASFGRLDVLINNAGAGIFMPLVDTSLEDWNNVIQTNLTGAFLCSREAFRIMKDQRGGRIINIGSVADYIPLGNNGAYSASKCGLRGLSSVINEEGKAYGVYATHLSLGAVFSEIWESRPGFSPSDMLSSQDVARTILNIVSMSPSMRLDEMKLLPPKGIL